METNQRLHTTQVFLPYYNPAHQTPTANGTEAVEGWQFALPPLREFEDVEDTFIIILGRKGNLNEVPRPEIRNHEGRPPRPIWAWVPIEQNGQRTWARPIAPYRKKGSIPLSELASLQRQKFFTPYGIEARGVVHNEPCDLETDVLANLSDGVVDLQLGEHYLGQAEVEDQQLICIEPSQLALDCQLWTSHLARVFETIAIEGGAL